MTRKRRPGPDFNFVSRGRKLDDYTVALARPEPDAARQAAEFCARLSRWLRMQGDDAKGNAEAPVTLAPSEQGDARLRLRCTEEAMLRIERQFAGEILSVAPPAAHQRGTIYPPKVDPWDISKW
jgi:hypothetical protein